MVQKSQHSTIEIRGDVTKNAVFDIQVSVLPRVTDQVADFHCVTTWSVRDLVWSGVRFLDFYREFVVPLRCHVRMRSMWYSAGLTVTPAACRLPTY